MRLGPTCTQYVRLAPLTVCVTGANPRTYCVHQPAHLLCCDWHQPAHLLCATGTNACTTVCVCATDANFVHLLCETGASRALSCMGTTGARPCTLEVVNILTVFSLSVNLKSSCEWHVLRLEKPIDCSELCVRLNTTHQSRSEHNS
jgi:hypothetical protein